MRDEQPSSKKKVARRKLKRGEYWCMYPKHRGDKPQLIHNPGPYFESNAKHFGHKIGVVRLVKV